MIDRVLLATFEMQQHLVELRTNFYLCTDVQQQPGGLSRLTLSNITRDHRLPPGSASITVGGSAMFFSYTASSQAHIASKLVLPVSDLLRDMNSVWVQPANDACTNHALMRSMKVVRKSEKNNKLQTFQDLGGFQMLLARFEWRWR